LSDEVAVGESKILRSGAACNNDRAIVIEILITIA